MSSQSEVPRTYLANGREPQPASSMTLARSVVAESHIATPRNTDWTSDQPKTRVPTVYPSQIMTMVSISADGTATPRSLFMSFAENESPIENMRNTTPSCAIVLID